MPSLAPDDIIFQEIATFASLNHLNVSLADLRGCARRIYGRLTDQLLSHREASQLLGVSGEMLHQYRRKGLIVGIRKSPHKKVLRHHWLYPMMEVLELSHQRLQNGGRV